jgi:hypothetical protein
MGVAAVQMLDCVERAVETASGADGDYEECMETRRLTGMMFLIQCNLMP